MTVTSVGATNAPTNNPPTFEEIKSAAGPVIDGMIWPFAFLTTVIWYLINFSSLAILLSAGSAATFAWLTMRNQAATVRLRETFTMLNRDNWDKDVIEARQVLRTISNELTNQPGGISKYAADSDTAATPAIVPFNMLSNRNDFIRKKITLLTILNDYENLALGVKHGILDESFLYQWMRSTLIRDWNTLSPLIYEYRRKSENPLVYVEFEGLAHQWAREFSFRTGAKLNKSERRLWIR